MKKMISVLSALILTATAVGCGANPQAPTTAPMQSAQSVPQGEAQQVSWPTKDVKIITTVKVGGNMDIKARLVSKYLSKELGVNVIVENLPGGGGVTGMTQYLAEKPNTHSLIYMGVPHLTTAPFFNDVQYTKDDITIISGLDTVENGLFVSAKSDIKTFEDLVKLGQTGKIIKFGSAGINNDTFLFTKALLESAKVKSDSVDADSSTESLVNCVAGTVDVAYCAMNLAKGYVEKGDLIPIGVFSADAYTGYAGMTVPSFKSLGYDVTYSATSFFAIRSGSDDAIVNKIETALNNVCANPEFQKEFTEAGYVLMDDRSKEGINGEIEKIHKDLEGYRSLFQ
ncbi:MAG: tripartite tricarboxylate transporter substrate binding protein [Angelakisella sp.]